MKRKIKEIVERLRKIIENRTLSEDEKTRNKFKEKQKFKKKY